MKEHLADMLGARGGRGGGDPLREKQLDRTHCKHLPTRNTKLSTFKLVHPLSSGLAGEIQVYSQTLWITGALNKSNRQVKREKKGHTLGKWEMHGT